MSERHFTDDCRVKLLEGTLTIQTISLHLAEIQKNTKDGRNTKNGSMLFRIQSLILCITPGALGLKKKWWSNLK